uniref:Uncharacterized protein n=1 Tax=Triticum urartu TaxID=4572 RepID=A0A8R7Q8J0_TRIUA
MHLRLGRVAAVVASSAAAAEEAMKTRDLDFAGRPRLLMVDRFYYGTGGIGFAPYGDHWRQARRVCAAHMLSARRVASLGRVRAQEAAALVGRVRRAGSGVVNLSDNLVVYSNAVISRCTLGDADCGVEGGGARLRKAFGEMEELLGTVPMGETVPWLGWVDTDGTGAEGETSLPGDGRAAGAGHHRPPPATPCCHRHQGRGRLRGRDAGRRRAGHGQHQVHHLGRARRRHGLDLRAPRVGDGGAHQPPARDAQAPGRGPRGRLPRRRRGRHGGPSPAPALPEGRDQRDPAAPPAVAAAAAAGDAGGHPAAGPRRAGGHPGPDQRLGHRPRPGDVGAPRRGVRAGEVRRVR